MFLILGELMEDEPTVFRDAHLPFMEAVRARSPRAARAAVNAHLGHGLGLIGPRLEASAG
jgi:DNA-binding GntR family transcriptional regulator